MNDLDLRTALHRQVEQPLSQPSAWADVQRGRRYVRRRRLRAGAASGAVVISAGLGWSALFPGSGVVQAPFEPAAPSRSSGSSVAESPAAESYVAPVWAPTAADYVPEELSPDEATDRCNGLVYDDGSPQSSHVESYYDTIYAGDDVDGYLVDQTMTGQDGSTQPQRILCTVPGAWAEGASTGSGPVSASDTGGILLACSNLRQIDLRSWTVAAAMSDGYGGIAASLVSPGQGYWVGCELGAQFEEIRFSNHRSPADMHRDPLADELSANGGSVCYPTEADCAGQVNSWAGVLPAGVESMAITQTDGTVLDVPVGVHGTYAIRLVVPIDAPPPAVTGYDGDGEIVYQGHLQD